MIRRQTQLGWLLLVAGFAAIGAGWAGVQSTPVVAVQLSYLTSGGIVGIALVILGTGMQRHDDLRIVRETVEEIRNRLDDLEFDLAETLGRPVIGSATPEGVKRKKTLTRSA